MTLLRGCDVSQFQSPYLVDWRRYDFGIVRASYGARPDSLCLEHAKRLRAAGRPIGLYHFLLPNSDFERQLQTFLAQAKAAHLSDGDLFPCLDIEAYPDRFAGKKPTHWAQVDKSWADEDTDALLRFRDEFDRIFGGVIPYITQRDWHLLGKPEWILERPLWVAHYPATGSRVPLSMPATPGSRKWRIWQQLVGPLDRVVQAPADPHAVDQNVAVRPLPLIGDSTHPDMDARLQTQQDSIPYLPITLTADDWRTLREARDRHIDQLHFGGPDS